MYQVRTLNHRHANAPVKQCVHIGFGQLTNGAIKKLYHIVVGMMARELIVGHKSAGAQAVLLAKNYGLFVSAQGRIHFGVRYSSLAQTAVGTSFARRLSCSSSLIPDNIKIPPIFGISGTHLCACSREARTYVFCALAAPDVVLLSGQYDRFEKVDVRR